MWTFIKQNGVASQHFMAPDNLSPTRSSTAGDEIWERKEQSTRWNKGSSDGYIGMELAQIVGVGTLESGSKKKKYAL